MFDYPTMLNDGRELFHRWQIVGERPWIERPRIHQWTPADKTGTNMVIAWSGDSLSLRAIDTVRREIADHCVSERVAWQHRYMVSPEFFGTFFGADRRKSVLNMVTVTPERTPRGFWPKLGRPFLLEFMNPVPRILAPGEPLEVAEVFDRFAIPMNRLVWAPRPGADRRRLRVGVTKAQRKSEGTDMTYTRAFLYDHIADADVVMAGRVPAVVDAIDGVGEAQRVHSPMVQFFRLFQNGSFELINFGLSRGSGLLTDIRWTSGRLDFLMTHSAEYARPFLEVARAGVTLTGT
jgi:hypothetical protein